MSNELLSLYLPHNNIILPAEVPCAARVNLQPAEHLLFCKQFSKMCPFVLASESKGDEGARIETAPKPSLDR